MKRRVPLRAAAWRWLGGLLGVSLVAASAMTLPLACAAGRASGGGGGGVGGNSFDAGNPDDSGLDPDAACAVASDDAKEVPVNMYIMFDKSGSMMGTKWSQTTAALQAFFMDPASAGLRVALSFFPHPSCGEGSCNAAACAHPQVPLGALTDLSAPTDAQEQLLTDAFVGITPSGGTPLSAALEGALSWGQSYLSSKPSERAVVVLVTDGDAVDCNTDSSYLIGITQQAADQAGVITFAVGLEGANTGLMNGIAHAGGTEQSIVVDTANAKDELLAALETIRDSAIACEYVLPDSVDGQPVDPAQVNVLYTPGGASEPVTIGQVPSEGHCTEQNGGWYYDDPLSPSRIIFCPSSCAAVQGDAGASLDVLIGCQTIPA